MANKMSPSTKKNKIITKILKGESKCTYCEKSFKKGTEITLDHVLPISQGGKNSDSNLVLSCFDCNQKKGNLLLTQFIKAYDIPITRLLDKLL